MIHGDGSALIACAESELELLYIIELSDAVSLKTSFRKSKSRERHDQIPVNGDRGCGDLEDPNIIILLDHAQEIVEVLRGNAAKIDVERESVARCEDLAERHLDEAVPSLRFGYAVARRESISQRISRLACRIREIKVCAVIDKNIRIITEIEILDEEMTVVLQSDRAEIAEIGYAVAVHALEDELHALEILVVELFVHHRSTLSTQSKVLKGHDDGLTRAARELDLAVPVLIVLIDDAEESAGVVTRVIEIKVKGVQPVKLSLQATRHDDPTVGLDVFLAALSILAVKRDAEGIGLIGLILKKGFMVQSDGCL